MTDSQELPQLEVPTPIPPHTYFIDGKQLTLSEGQIKAVEAIQSGKNVFLTGEPGTGKSVVLKVLRQLAYRMNKSVAFLAPTGIAALQIGGSTIHSFFRFPVKPLHPEFGESFGQQHRIRDLLKVTDILVIDEGSMVRSDIFTAIFTACQAAMQSKKPFGGKQVLVVADFFQLPPVVEDPQLYPWLNMLFGGVMCCHTHAWKQAEFEIVGLTQNQRQKHDNAFAEALQMVRVGEVEGLERINRMATHDKELRGTIITFTNDSARAINESRLADIPRDSFTYSAKISKFAVAPVDQEIELKVGARVMLMANKDGFVNGDLGEVLGLYLDHVEVQLDRGPRVLVYEYTWDKKEYKVSGSQLEEAVVGGFTQLPIKLGWAITAHKSQGQTLQEITLPMYTVPFERGQLYVALSRVPSGSKLTLGRPLTPRDIGVTV